MPVFGCFLNGIYRLKEANYSTGDYYHYTYDAVGNRKTQEKMIIDLLSTDSYNYDDANRLTDVNGVTYTFDANGNLLNDGVNAYTYDSANRLKTMNSGQPSESSYQYTGLGDRISQTMNGQQTNYTLDLNAGLTQVLNDGTNTYVYGLGRIAQVNTGTEYFLGDALGSVRQLTNQSGAITYARVYDPYGTVTQTSGAARTAYGYTGEFTSNNMVYLRARMYSPGMGRFLTRDTWTGDSNQPMSYNSWLYVYGNPVNFTDPTGQQPRDLTQWLYNEMVYNATNDPVVLYMRSRNRIAGRLFAIGTTTCFVGLIPEPAMPYVIAAGLGIDAAALYAHVNTLYPTFYNQVQNGGRWDFKDEIGIKIGPGFTLCTSGSGGCFNDIEYSVAGNIFYGYIGRASGILWPEIKAGAAFAERIDGAHDPSNTQEYVPTPSDYDASPFFNFSDPVSSNFGDEIKDNNAVTMGIKLWDKYKENMTLGDFQRELSSYVGKLTRHPARPIPVSSDVANLWPYPVGYFNNVPGHFYRLNQEVP